MRPRRVRDVELAVDVSRSVTTANVLTSPNNQTTFLDDVGKHPAPALMPRRGIASQRELDAAVERGIREMNFCSAMPLRSWISRADMLKRMADQHHTAGDLEQQYIWYVPLLTSLAQCAALLTQLIPRGHAAYNTVDTETPTLVQMTREALAAHRAELTGGKSHVDVERSTPMPKRSSLRKSVSPQSSSASKRVSFAEPEPQKRSFPRFKWREKETDLGSPKRPPAIVAPGQSAPAKNSPKSASGINLRSVFGLRRRETPEAAKIASVDARALAPRSLQWEFERMNVRAPEPAPMVVREHPAGLRPGVQSPVDAETSRDAALRRTRYHSQLPALPGRTGLHRAASMHSSPPLDSGAKPGGLQRVSSTYSGATRTPAARQQRRAASREEAYPSALSFTSSPLEPFAPSHARLSFSGELPEEPLVRRRSSVVRPFMSEHQQQQGFTLEHDSGEAMRRLCVPRSVVPRFLALAEHQSARGRETCALLMGREHRGVLHVTDLVAPPQTGEPDSCLAEGEELLVGYQEEHGLLTLGWIHTHPSQSCFLSSLDLHTQAAYQALLPEAIAIVCALQHSPSVGIFRLTRPEGLRCVLQCRDPAPFHPHGSGDDDPAMYTDALGDGVAMNDGPLVVRDLR